MNGFVLTSFFSGSIAWLPALASGFALVFTFTFAALVLSRYLEHGGRYFFFWGLGVFFLGLAVFCELLLKFFFALTLVRLWLLGFSLLALTWLGQGSLLWFFKNERLIKMSSAFLMLFSFAAAISVNSLNTETLALAQDLKAIPFVYTQLYTQILRSLSWFFTFVFWFNLYGCMLLLAGLSASIWRFFSGQDSLFLFLSLLLFHVTALLLAVLIFFPEQNLYSHFLPLLSFLLLCAYLLFIRFSKNSPLQEKTLPRNSMQRLAK